MNSLWSHGFVDLEAEPMIVSVPDMDGRYIVVQGLNMWTDDFMSEGTRTNGGKAANYLIAGPLKYNSDGSLDSYLQRDSPGVERESNWQPIPPSGMFNLTVRSYQPGPGLLDGTYKLPPVMKVQ